MDIKKSEREKYRNNKIKKLSRVIGCKEITAYKLYKLLDRKVYLIDILIDLYNEKDDISLIDISSYGTKNNEHSLLVYLTFKLIKGMTISFENEIKPLINPLIEDNLLLNISNLLPVDYSYIYTKKVKFVTLPDGTFIGKANFIALLCNIIRFQGVNILEIDKQGVFKILLEDFHVCNLCIHNKSTNKNELINLVKNNKIQNRELLFNSLSGEKDWKKIIIDEHHRVIYNRKYGYILEYIHNEDGIFLKLYEYNPSLMKRLKGDFSINEIENSHLLIEVGNKNI